MIREGSLGYGCGGVACRNKDCVRDASRGAAPAPRRTVRSTLWFPNRRRAERQALISSRPLNVIFQVAGVVTRRPFTPMQFEQQFEPSTTVR